MKAHSDLTVGIRHNGVERGKFTADEYTEVAAAAARRWSAQCEVNRLHTQCIEYMPVSEFLVFKSINGNEVNLGLRQIHPPLVPF